MDRRTVLKMAAFGPYLAARAASATEVTDQLWAEVDTAAGRLIAEQATPGLSISVLRRGRFVYSKNFGLANLETQTQMAPRSVYLIGSITKQFTAASLMLLAEAGKLSIDDPLSKYFPDFPRSGEISLRQMLTHTSGLGEFTNINTDKRASFIQQARLDYDADGLYKLMLATDPLYPFAPGTVWAYSDTAYVLLGLIVEKVTGRPYGLVYRDGVIARAGLSDTAVDDAADVVSRRVSGYASSEGASGHWNNASFISRTIAGGAGSMRSTSEDLCRWHDALLSGRVVSAASLREMITPQRLENGELPPRDSSPTDKGPPELAAYGLGLAIDTIDGYQTIGHLGHINGFTSSLISFPAEGVNIAIMANCRLDPERLKAMLQTVIAVGVHADFSRRTSVFYR